MRECELRNVARPKPRGRPPRLHPSQWSEICLRLLDGERTSSLAREFGLAKSAISGRLGKQVRNTKLEAIKKLKTEFSEQIIKVPSTERAQLIAMHECLITYAFSVIRHKHGRVQGRHSEP